MNRRIVHQIGLHFQKKWSPEQVLGTTRTRIRSFGWFHHTIWRAKSPKISIHFWSTLESPNRDCGTTPWPAPCKVELLTMISYQKCCKDAIGCNGMQWTAGPGQSFLTDGFFKKFLQLTASPHFEIYSWRAEQGCQLHSFVTKAWENFSCVWSDPSVTQDRTAALEPSASATAASHPSGPHPVVQWSLAKPRSVDNRIHDDHKHTNPVPRKLAESMANGCLGVGLEGLM